MPFLLVYNVEHKQMVLCGRETNRMIRLRCEFKMIRRTWMAENYAIKRRGVETKLIIDNGTASQPANPDPALIKAVARAHV